MIRMIPSQSADQAKSYYVEALSKSDYYTGNDQELPGTFRGRLAERLGLLGLVDRQAFFLLCENRNPITGQTLTPITKDGRIIGYDINYHVPKSVSIIHAFSTDTHTLEAFEKSMHETMQEIEADARTRVRKKGVYDDRTTGDLLYASFIHQTARPVGNHTSDMHLHGHNFVFNCTYDEKEKKIKAGKFRFIKQSMPYYQSRFYKRLSDRLIELGYHIRFTERSFEIVGVPDNVIKLFSKRTQQIEKTAKERGITNKLALADLGAKTRGKKEKGVSMADLKEDWRRQIAELEKDHGTWDSPIRYAADRSMVPLTREDCIHHAIMQGFERASVLSERKLLELAARHAIGQTAVTLDDLQTALQNDKRIIRIKHNGQTLLTTKEVLQEEKRMVELARQGIGKMNSLYPHIRDVDKNNQEHLVIEELLTTTNQFSIVRGVAGAGKTTLMTKAIPLIRNAGKKVTIVAPTAKAARGVLRENFKDAETVAKLFVDSDMQNQLKDGVLWVDESGLMGVKDCLKILELATAKNCRVVFAGDTRQHASVVRGDALRILNTVGNLPTAELNIIRRQKNELYKSAVQNLADGLVSPAFDKLNEMGAIKTIDRNNPHAELVNRYVDVIKAKRSALVISPTHAEGEAVTIDLRAGLKEAGLIGKKEAKRVRYVNRNMTEAEKADFRNYEPGQAVQFSQHVHGMRRGSIWTISKVSGLDVCLTDEKGETNLLPLNRAKHFDVFNKTEINIAKGDKIRITRNTYDNELKRLDNGMALEVVSVTLAGHLRLRNPNGKTVYVLDKDYGHLAHDYCVTSHASQGATVDEVFISQPASTFGATNAKQFYVSVSRGRDAVHIFTDDKEALLESAKDMGDRQSALELVGDNKMKPIDYILTKTRSEHPDGIKPETAPKPKFIDKSITPNKLDLDYEQPGL